MTEADYSAYLRFFPFVQLTSVGQFLFHKPKDDKDPCGRLNPYDKPNNPSDKPADKPSRDDKKEPSSSKGDNKQRPCV